jgi:non-homologous end joining protein Ku
LGGRRGSRRKSRASAEQVAPDDEIGRVYGDNPYYLAPDGKLAQDAFGVAKSG